MKKYRSLAAGFAAILMAGALTACAGNGPTRMSDAECWQVHPFPHQVRLAVADGTCNASALKR